VTDWFEIVCHFSEKEKFKHCCVFLLPNVSPLDSVGSVICRFVWNCFRNFHNLSEPLLKSNRTCISLKSHLRDWQVSYKHYQNWFQ